MSLSNAASSVSLVVNNNTSGVPLASLGPIFTFSALAVGASVNADGAKPVAGLVLSGNTLYGTALNGGAAGAGTVFRVNTNGSGFTNLFSFSGLTDGEFPYAGLVLASN